MKMTSKKILFFGNERLATGLQTNTPVLHALVNAGYKVKALVIAQNDGQQSRNARELEIVKVAEEYGIPTLRIQRLKDTGEQLKAYNAEAAILIAYGKIVPQAIIDIFPRGIINIHPSLLPLHRGPTPLESAILNDERETGVSLMQLSSKMDAGPVYAQKRTPLNGNQSKIELAHTLSAIGGEMLIQYLPAILSGDLLPIAQVDHLATYDTLITKADGQIDWEKPASQLEREVRAYAVWPRTRTRIGKLEIIITQAHTLPRYTLGIQQKDWNNNREIRKNSVGAIVQLTNHDLGFITATDVLMIDRLVPSGKKEMSIKAFLAGYHAD
jgi:methionyl-tRNA formyltransferase